MTEVTNPATLGDAKAKLQSLGIQDLSHVASISLDDHLLIANPGLIAPAGFTSPAAQPIGGLAPEGISTFSVPSWPQTESVIIADELDLTNKTITILRERVSHLWIIARRLVATSGATITFAPLLNPNVGANGPDGTPNPGQPNFNPHTRQSGSGGHATNGGGGPPGKPGAPGPAGLDGPSLTICVLQIDAMPDIILPGQQGGSGGAGGHGANAGNGERGRDSKVKYWLGSPVDCSHGPGWGGNGGRGGDGGQGGPGGTGGDGGDVNFLTPEDQLVPLLTAHAFVLDNGSGPGGQPGSQGDAGNGGQGGDAGYNTGWPCSDEPQRHGEPGLPGNRMGDLGPGTPGAPGQVLFSIITEADWELLLEAPWITSIEPAVAIAGDQLIVHGLHFVDGTTIFIDGVAVPTTFDFPEQVVCTISDSITGGQHDVVARTPDGDLSNSVPLSIRPWITDLERTGALGTPVTTIWAGDSGSLSLMGKSFDSGAALSMDGKVLDSTWASETEIQFQVPAVVGEDPGGQSRLKVHNPDGLESDELAVTRLPSLDSGFRASRNGWPFHNFDHGRPDWDTFLDTFGREEVAEAEVEHPILTPAFYLALLYYLDNYGHCTSIAATSLRAYSQGQTDLFDSITPADPNADPPDIGHGLRHRLNVVQGREFSREVLTHYADQCREGIDRVELSVRDIEASFRAGLGESTATVLCFLPSGNIYDMIADPEVRKAFVDSHCIVPAQIVYSDPLQGLDQAHLYVYDNNYQDRDDLFITLTQQDGKIHFDYQPDPVTDPSYHYSSERGYTLGTATLPLIEIKDVDLPFSGPSAELAAFIVDIVLSPISLSIEDPDGALLGVRDGKIHNNPALGHVSPWLENYMLLRTDTQATRRLLSGRETGTYTYITIHPNGTSLTVKDAACSPNTMDSLTIEHGLGNVVVQTNEDKQLDLHLAGAMPDGTVRYVNLGYDARGGEAATLAPSARLDGLSFSVGDRDVDLRLIVRTLEGSTVMEEQTVEGTVSAGKSLRLPQGMWMDLGALSL